MYDVVTEVAHLWGGYTMKSPLQSLWVLFSELALQESENTLRFFFNDLVNRGLVDPSSIDPTIISSCDFKNMIPEGGMDIAWNMRASRMEGTLIVDFRLSDPKFV